MGSYRINRVYKNKSWSYPMYHSQYLVSSSYFVNVSVVKVWELFKVTVTLIYILLPGMHCLRKENHLVDLFSLVVCVISMILSYSITLFSLVLCQTRLWAKRSITSHTGTQLSPGYSAQRWGETAKPWWWGNTSSCVWYPTVSFTTCLPRDYIFFFKCIDLPEKKS